MQIFTIGFTKTSAEHFFTRLEQAQVKRLIDVRLNNVSQLSGFAKRDDLAYFVKRVVGIPYEHEMRLAPDSDMLKSYRGGGTAWDAYERAYLSLIASRQVETTLSATAFDGACLLCSEDKPAHCHRRLAAEYLQARWSEVEIVHL